MIFGDHTHRVSEVSQHFQTAACNFEFSFYGLIDIGNAAHGNHLGLPFGRAQFLPQQLGSIVFDHNLGFEIHAQRVPEIFVVRTSITVYTAVFATAIGVYTGFEGNILTLVIGDDVFRIVLNKLCFRGRFLSCFFIQIIIHIMAFKTVDGTIGRTSSPDGILQIGHIDLLNHLHMYYTYNVWIRMVF